MLKISSADDLDHRPSQVTLASEDAAEHEQSASSYLPETLFPGAPVEQANPLGKHVTLLSATMLNVGQMMGSGIYAVPGVMLDSVGSIGLLLAYWIIAPLFAFAGLSLYTELASMFPRRSGGEVAFLEQAYPHPRFLISTAFAATAILMSFSATNAIIFSQYFLSALHLPISNHNQTFVAISAVLITSVGVSLSTKWSLKAVNVLTVVKIISMSFMVVTGVVVLLGLTSIPDPYANFRQPFKGSIWSLNNLFIAFIKSNHAFIGWHNAFYLLGEVKGPNPIRTVRKSGRISLFLVSIMFLLINIAYVAAIPYDELRTSGSLVAVNFFRRAYGPRGTRFLPLLVSLSCFGNMVAVTVGQARIIREVARQGLLPYPTFLASIKPFGTPIGPIGLKGFLTVLVIAVLPAQDAFNFIVDLASYPAMFFQSLLSIGVWRLRNRRKAAGILPSSFRANNQTIILYLVSCVLLLLLPWIPPPPGHADVSFWYATYCVVGIALLVLCGLYYWLWIVLLPRIGGYEIVEEVETSEDGVRNTRLVRRYTHHREAQPLLDTRPLQGP